MNTPTLTEAVMFYMRYHPKTGLVALVELDALNAIAQERDPSVLVEINNEPQRIIGRESIGGYQFRSATRKCYCKAMPVVIVERK